MAELKERYAAALLELSIESGQTKEQIEQAVLIRDTLRNGDAEAFLAHPGIPADAKREFLRRLFEKKVFDGLMGFLYLAVAKNRETLILPALEAYIDMGNRQQGKMPATVVSAVPLRREQADALQSLLSKKLNKQVEVVFKTDPAVIGGLYLQIDDRLIDRTVRTRLKKMTEMVRKGGIE